MRRLIVVGTILMGLLAGESAAKYKMPPGMPDMQTKMSRKTARYQINTRDADGDDKLNLQEYKNHKMSREDRRIERRQKKDGTYKSPEELFKLMDSNKDGFLTHEEMMVYYATGKPLEVKEEEKKADSTDTEDSENAADTAAEEETEESGEDAEEQTEAAETVTEAESRLQAGEPFQPWLNDDQPAPAGWQGPQESEEDKK